MIGSIAGDMIGSPYERFPVKQKEFDLRVSAFTDDTVLTVAVASAIITDGDYAEALKTLAQKYPNAGYGIAFRRWIWSRTNEPYNSWGNGSAMRVSPVGFAYNSEAEVLDQAEQSAAVTHNHPEGVKGAQATALAILMARQNADKETIRQEIERRFGYNLDRSLDTIRPGYRFDVSCQGSVPESIISFLESEDYESAIKNAVSLGGDADTMACIAGGIAQAYYKSIPAYIILDVRSRLPKDLLEIVDRFNTEYRCECVEKPSHVHPDESK